MSADPITRFPPARKARRGPRDHLRTALLDMAVGHGIITDHKEQSWASITFTGTRHHLSIVFDGANAVEAGESMVAALPEHEFTIPGQLVADATVSAAESTLLPHPKLTVECELLLLVDS
ncbi:hypothetical protein HKD42_07310 [Altererythrobacter sp. RZ02]|uniref:Uncharacterized protein n=1 Tax=Pontixanthobacter rizhaonensis TaxID=2730337 RepID=A0A848QL54_9SPHN|nr:hypothetical protein [Pontixanthobacter rizhaonensis]NMW31864.1 hypothetical protein [Pontixanthobacter rizhaonensis]